MKQNLFTFCALLFLSINLSGQEPLKHLYLGNDTHTDLMWNATEDEWYKYNLDMAKFYLNLGESTKGNTPEARSKWNYDVAWTLDMMEKRTPKEFFNRVIDQIKLGQASVPFNYTLPVYGASTLESVLRSFYYAGHLERTYGLDIDLAICQENATIPLGLASLWAGSGAKYSWRGVCNCATRINTIGPREHEIYWYTGLDGSRLLMKWYSNFGWSAELGGYGEMLEPTVAVIQMDTLCGSKRYPYNIAGAFGKGWDNMQNYSYDLSWGLAHRTRPGTKLYLSDQIDFFKHFESEYGKDLPSETVSYGNEWDINLASLAEVSGQLKLSMEKLRTAETMAAIVSYGDNKKLALLEPLKQDFLHGIGMYNLHGWTADGPISRHDFATYMRKQQTNVSKYIDSLLSFSILEMDKMIDPRGKKNVVFVFNALNWERNGFVDIKINGDFNAILDMENGKTTEGIVIAEDKQRYLRVYVNNLPSVGYKLLQLVNLRKQATKEMFTFFEDKLETPFYTVKLTKSGAIASLFDKKMKKEWVKGKLNDLGGSEPDNGENLKVIEKDARHIKILCASGSLVKHHCLITFYADNTRIDFDNTIQQNFDGILHWSFGFNVDQPEVWHEEVGAVIKAKLTSAGGHYATKMARYDYLTLNHFVNVGNSKESITLSNADCLFFRLGNSKTDFLDMNSSVIHVLIGGQVNENLGVISQDRDTLFNQHFSLMPQDHAFNQGESMCFSLEHQNPLQAGYVLEGGSLKEKKFSFFTNDDKNSILWTLKPGEEDGVIIRLWNMESKTKTARISFGKPLQKAMYASHVETNIAEVPVSRNSLTVELNPNQIKTYHVWMK
jgi:alpha-mannosidase